MSKKLVQEYLKKSENIKAEVIFDDGKSFEVLFKGDINKTMSDKGFSQKQLEQLQGLLQPIVDRLDNLETKVDKLETKVDNIDKRLTIVEKDVKDIKSCPTIAKELKEAKK